MEAPEQSEGGGSKEVVPNANTSVPKEDIEQVRKSFVIPQSSAVPEAEGDRSGTERERDVTDFIDHLEDVLSKYVTRNGRPLYSLEYDTPSLGEVARLVCTSCVGYENNDSHYSSEGDGGAAVIILTRGEDGKLHGRIESVAEHADDVPGELREALEQALEQCKFKGGVLHGMSRVVFEKALQDMRNLRGELHRSNPAYERRLNTLFNMLEGRKTLEEEWTIEGIRAILCSLNEEEVGEFRMDHAIEKMRVLRRNNPEKYSEMLALYKNMSTGGDADGVRFLRGFRGVPDADYQALVEALEKGENKGFLDTVRALFRRK